MNKVLFLIWANEKGLLSALDRAKAFGISEFQRETWIIAFKDQHTFK